MRRWSLLIALCAAGVGCGGTGAGASLLCDMSRTSDSTVERCHEGLAARRQERHKRDAAASSCDQGDVQSCYDTARYDDRERRESAATVRRYQRACTAGIADACFRVADFWHSGRGVRADPARARQLLAQACDGGHGAACAALAQGTPERREQLRLQQRACDHADWPSCQRLGEAYWRGAGVTVDLAIARSFLGRACRGGHQEACVALGQLDSEAAP